jgi:hypothetical protein
MRADIINSMTHLWWLGRNNSGQQNIMITTTYLHWLVRMYLAIPL